MKKFIYYLSKLTHKIVPFSILMNTLRRADKSSILRRLVPYFDPNNIRKVHGFDLTEREIILKGDGWNLLVNPRDHIGFRSYIKNQPFEMAVYHLAEKLKTSNRKVVIDVGANIGTASVPICSQNDYELVAVEASKDNGRLLAKNIVNNNIRAKLFLYALVDEVKENYVKLFINKGNTGANSLNKSWNPSKGLKEMSSFEFAPSKTLDEVVKEARLIISEISLSKLMWRV